LNELSTYGFEVAPEDARQIIKQQIREGGQGVPWKYKQLYTRLMLEASVKSYEAMSQKESTSICFFDRAIIDTLCYARMAGLGISSQMDNIAKRYLYNRNVFILSPWLDIYNTDNERKQTWEEAVFTFKEMKKIYSTYGYAVIEVPIDTLTNRVSFILSKVKHV
jgi:predicted ATPase